MAARVRTWLHRGLVVVVSCFALLACIDEPSFQLAGDAGAPAAPADTTTPPTTITPPSNDDSDAGGDDSDDDGGDDPASYVPDGGVTGPGTTACGGKVCAVGFTCCKDKCKNVKAKC